MKFESKNELRNYNIRFRKQLNAKIKKIKGASKQKK